MSETDPRLAPLIDIPYADLASEPGALDGCWGLVVRAYAAFGVELPLFGPDDVAAEGAALVEGAARDWRCVAGPHQPFGPIHWTETPRLLDVAYLRVLGHPHVGLIASADGSRMLHVHAPAWESAAQHASHVVRLGERAWKNVLGVYRPPAGSEARFE